MQVTDQSEGGQKPGPDPEKILLAQRSDPKGTECRFNKLGPSSNWVEGGTCRRAGRVVTIWWQWGGGESRLWDLARNISSGRTLGTDVP